MNTRVRVTETPMCAKHCNTISNNNNINDNNNSTRINNNNNNMININVKQYNF